MVKIVPTSEGNHKHSPSVNVLGGAGPSWRANRTCYPLCAKSQAATKIAAMIIERVVASTRNMKCSELLH